MIRRPPGSTRTDTLCPDTTLSRSKAILGLGYERDRWGVDAMLTTAARRNKVEYPDATAAASNPDFRAPGYGVVDLMRSEEHTSELQSLMRISYAVFCLKKKKNLN